MFLVMLACVTAPKPTPQGPASSSSLERIPMAEGEVWRGEVGIAFARDVLGDPAVDLCLEQLGEVYDSCAMRLHDCLTVVVTSPTDATVVLDAQGCGSRSPDNAWLVVDKEGEAETKLVGTE